MIVLAATAGGSNLLASEVLALFAVLGLGLALGRVRVAGIALGSSAVLFTGLWLGHLGYSVPGGVAKLGLVLFVYCVGITAGPGFFRAFARHGAALAALSGTLVAVGALAAWCCAVVFDLPSDLASGLFAGSMTSTPALAAALESFTEPASAGRIAVGYGLAYPFGVVGVVLFVEFLPRLSGWSIAEAGSPEAGGADEEDTIHRVLVEVRNPAVIGRELGRVAFLERSPCRVSRHLQGDRLVPVPNGFVLEEGQVVLVVGREADLAPCIDLLGRRREGDTYVLDTEGQTARVVATSRNVVGRRLRELDLLSVFGVNVSRITRHDLEFVPGPEERVQHADMLLVVGQRTNLDRFAAFAGHRARTFDESDLFSVAVSLVLGLLLGAVELSLGGRSFALGDAGGPLIVGLLLGHFGRVGPITGHLPRASRLLLMEFGLLLFLAGAGVTAGGRLAEVLRDHGSTLTVTAIIVTLAPLVVGGLVARRLFGLGRLECLGGVTGAMTSTPGLAAVTAKTESKTPLVSYAAAYPVALVLTTVVTRALVALLVHEG